MFPSELDVRVVDEGYMVLHAFKYIPARGPAITVPPGFVTDFASIPRGFRWWITGHGKTRKPAVIHDYLYATWGSHRDKADKIFLEALGEVGVSPWKAKLCYRAVRAFGWAAFKEREDGRYDTKDQGR